MFSVWEMYLIPEKWNKIYSIGNLKLQSKFDYCIRKNVIDIG